eukprot:gene22404-29515_t
MHSHRGLDPRELLLWGHRSLDESTGTRSARTSLSKTWSLPVGLLLQAARQLGRGSNPLDDLSSNSMDSDTGRAERRLRVLSQHIGGAFPTPSDGPAAFAAASGHAAAVGYDHAMMPVALNTTAARIGEGRSSSYATATGSPSSYARIHGEVSREPVGWTRTESVSMEKLTDVLYDKGEGIAKITINRPEKRNAFRPRTVTEMSLCFADARDDPEIGVIILTGAGDLAFCSGGDQEVRGKGGYVGADGVPRLNVLDLQMQIRRLPKPVIAMVAGYAVGGGHILHMVCDLTVAADNAIFGQSGPKVGSFDAGYGSTRGPVSEVA